jgi:predicted aspartyl protease
MRFRAPLSMAAALLAAAPAYAEGQCQLLQAASVPMTIDSSGRIAVPMSMGGKPVTMMVDTGSPMSVVTYKTARDLGLNIKNVELGRAGVAQWTMFGGLTIAQYTKASDVAIGTLKSDSMGFGIFPGTNELAENNGLLGDDVMSNYDIDFDFAGGKFNLFSKDHCAGQVVYWTRTPVAVVPFSRNIWKHIFLDVELDGKKFRALLDTGASTSEGDWEPIADAFDLTAHNPGVSTEGHPADGDGAYHYTFKTLTFGGISVSNPQIALVPRAVSQIQNGPSDHDIILGINVMRRLHIYVAEDEEKLYITPATAH